MAKTFFPEKSRLVAASPPHPPEARYKVSIGLERLGASYVPVVKVQMAYGENVAGPKSPSYPVGTDDHERVERAIRELLGEGYQALQEAEGGR